MKFGKKNKGDAAVDNVVKEAVDQAVGDQVSSSGNQTPVSSDNAKI